MKNALKQRILLLDGAMGSLLQQRMPAYRGLADELVLTQPEAIAQIHRSYIEAGADCITTCTFNSQFRPDICIEAARLARKIADEVVEKSGTRRYMLGDVGPMSPSITTEVLYRSYRAQMDALMQGGADALLIETATDLRVVETACRAAGDYPILVSMTPGKDGRMLSGHSIREFVEKVLRYNPIAIGMNCGYGADEIEPWIKEMYQTVAERCPLMCYPNAGLPNAQGVYSMAPDEWVARMCKIVEAYGISMAGGCCGTTPAHIRALAHAIK